MARELFRETLPSGNLIVSLVSEIEDGDFSADQTRNRKLKENQSKLSNGEWNWLSQVHGTEIIWLDENKRVSGIEGDALATSSQKVIAITVADCLPLLLIEESGILSLLHLGWRGIKEGLLEKSIRLIKTKSQEPMGAVMGPCINACCYEFGQNDMDILVEKYGPKIVSETLEYANQNEIPLNSLEGFIRQIIGWREFIRGIYTTEGVRQRNGNFWKFNREIPNAFYTGDTGLDPLDNTIKHCLESGYTHHIERLMILGNIMVLLGIKPESVYNWFMEIFIDSYDWVMVPNVYGMSQFADGGTFATKPYIGGSNYIKKMSNYGQGPWSAIWDGLFWRFISVNQDFFLKNPRMSMMVHSFNRMSDEKRTLHLENAAAFLAQLDRK